jgi:malonyl-CoA O-methyltransferase
LRKVATQTGYDQWAGQYDHDGNPLIALEGRALDAWLRGQPAADAQALDVGCGTGRVLLKLAARGWQATGIDFSAGMLAEAQKKIARGAEGMSAAPLLITHDLEERFPFADASFSLVTSCLVLEHIRDISAFFSETARVASPGAALFFSAMHPAMFLRGGQANFDDPESGEEIRMTSYPHCIADFVNAMLRAGLVLHGMLEDSPDAAFAEEFPRGSPLIGWPLLVCFAVEKPFEP